MYIYYTNNYIYVYNANPQISIHMYIDTAPYYVHMYRLGLPSTAPSRSLPSLSPLPFTKVQLLQVLNVICQH
jgi:hypothetical protein